MDWKKYSVEPDEGMFEKIQKTVRRRRAWRLGSMAAVVFVVTGLAVWMLAGRTSDAGNNTVAQAVSAESGLSATPVNNEGSTMEETKAMDNRQTNAIVLGEEKSAVVKENKAIAGELVASVTEEPQPLAPQGEEWHNIAPTRRAVPVENKIQESKEQTVASQPAQEPTTAAATKSGTPDPVPPHYDNLLWAPNVISPTAPDGKNSTFKLTCTSTVTEFHLYIYNRGGRKVYSSDDILREWDATYDGTALPQGTYVWVATFRDSDGMPRHEQGTVTVLR